MYWLDCQDEDVLINISKITAIEKCPLGNNTYRILFDGRYLFFTDEEKWNKAWESIQTAIMSRGQGIITIHSDNYLNWLDKHDY